MMTADGRDGVPGIGWVLALALSLATGLALGLALVWVNIERTNLGYGVRRLKGELESRQAHTIGLEVERDRLLSPYMLDKKAKELGMGPAKAGQNRRMDNGTLQTLPR